MIKTILLGRMTKDIELRYNSNNTAVASFTLACSTGYTDKDGNRETEFVNCVAFSKSAENIQKYCGKGSQLLVNGRNKTNMYEKDGEKRYSTSVIVESFEFVSNGTKKEEKEEAQETNIKLDEIELSADDLPF